MLGLKGILKGGGKGEKHDSKYERVMEFEEKGFSSFPPLIDPATSMPPSRKIKKQQQIESIIRCLTPLIISHDLNRGNKKVLSKNSGGRPCVVDFCGGTGHLGLAVAWLFPHWRVICVDLNEKSLILGKKRAQEVSMLNYDTKNEDVRNFKGEFNIGVALHACGAASDHVIKTCLNHDADMVIIPCCVGGINTMRSSISGRELPLSSLTAAAKKRKKKKFATPLRGTRRRKLHSGEQKEDKGESDGRDEGRGKGEGTPKPHSKVFQTALDRKSLSEKQCDFPEWLDPYVELARAADFGDSVSGTTQIWRRRAKELIEHDRILHISAKNPKLHTTIIKMKPLTASPKNDIIIASHFPIPLNPKAPRASSSRSGDSKTEDPFGQFPPEQVKDAKVRIRKWMDKGGSETLEFTNLTGKRHRKIVHAVAESLGLGHRSVGDRRGKGRHVVVYRQ
uniref:R3H domain-containing protein n=1 Tax=Amorphochlora amoebiformis TaxID=1561963 RepID=A0A6T6WKG0_9EUKA